MMTLESIIDNFKNKLDAGNRLNEIISPNETIGQVRIEDGNNIIQLRWEIKNINTISFEKRIISFKNDKNAKWEIIPVDQIKNGVQEQINNKFTEIKNKILNKNNKSIIEEVNKNGMQGNEKNNKENKEITHLNSGINNTEIIEIKTTNKVDIDSKEIKKSNIIKKSKGRPKKIVNK